MRKYYYDFCIAESKDWAGESNWSTPRRPILVPDAGVQITRSDILSDDSGYDESYVYHRKVARAGVYKFDFSYANLTLEEYRYLEEMLIGIEEYILVEFRDLDGNVKQVNAHCEKVSASLYNSQTGHYKKLKFTLQEC